MNKVRSYAVSLVLLGLFCLVVEQVGYCLFVPGYFYQLVTSAVFWGCFSVMCFFWLRLLNFQNEEPVQSGNMKISDDLYYFIFKAPLSMDNPDNLFSRNLRGW